MTRKDERLTNRTITTGSAPQELVDMVRQGMDPEDQGKATDGKLRCLPDFSKSS